MSVVDHELADDLHLHPSDFLYTSEVPCLMKPRTVMRSHFDHDAVLLKSRRIIAADIVVMQKVCSISE